MANVNLYKMVYICQRIFILSQIMQITFFNQDATCEVVPMRACKFEPHKLWINFCTLIQCTELK